MTNTIRKRLEEIRERHAALPPMLAALQSARETAWLIERVDRLKKVEEAAREVVASEDAGVYAMATGFTGDLSTLGERTTEAIAALRSALQEGE